MRFTSFQPAAALPWVKSPADLLQICRERRSVAVVASHVNLHRDDLAESLAEFGDSVYFAP